MLIHSNKSNMITPKENTKRLCLIPLCKNERFDLVHKFPMDNQRAEEWRRAINIPEINSLSLDMLRKRTICSKHFRKEDYKNVESRSLNKTAVPSLNFTQPEKSNSGVTVKCHDQSLFGGINADGGFLMECQILMQNKREPVSNGSTTINIDAENSQQHRHLFQYVCNDEGPSSKYRFVDSNQELSIQCSQTQLDLVPGTKALDGKFEKSLVSGDTVLNLEDSITLIDQSSQFNFLTTKDVVSYVRNFNANASGNTEDINSSYLSKYRTFFLFILFC